MTEKHPQPAAPVRLRVAPSPTGDPHVGTAYMALFNLAFVRQQGGAFVLRIEDTDQARFRADSETQLYETLSWLGLDWDEGPDRGGPYAPYRQSERLATYRPYVDQLLADGHAYYCWCSPDRLREMRAEQERSKSKTIGYDRLCYGKTEAERAALPGFQATPVVRMLVPEDAPTKFPDLIRGTVSAPFPDDQVILKADGFPTYHMAVVVDDHEMGITHVVRGEEWISSTPKHLLLYQWLGLTPPAFAHMPLLRNPDRSKISKRKNPAARLTWFQEEGYLPEALVNFLALLAYPPAQDDEGKDIEVFGLAEFAARFDWSKVIPVGPIFDLAKLDWLNGVYIRSLSVPELADRLRPFLVADGLDMSDQARLEGFTELIQPRLVHLTDAADQLCPFYTASADLVVDDDARASLNEDTPAVLTAAIAALEELPDWEKTEIETALRAAVVDGLAIKPRFAFGPLRVALSGRRVSPPLFESMALMGREATLERLQRLLASL
jgi:glutamyl-tRNA synthetase